MTFSVLFQDFREKGGYSRDVIDVIDDSNGEIIKVLLYRGTPDNPGFWPRALFDLPFAAGKSSNMLFCFYLFEDNDSHYMFSKCIQYHDLFVFVFVCACACVCVCVL